MTPQEAVRAALTETIWWAREASQTSSTPSGYNEHGTPWEWHCGQCSWKDSRIPELNPVTDSWVECPRCHTTAVSLYGDGVLFNTEEVPIDAGGHIIRNDPAAVVQLSEALLKILDICDGTLTDHFEDEHFRMACTLAAAVIAVLKSGVVREPR